MTYPRMHSDTRVWIGGNFRHFKGGRYKVLDVARDSETNSFIVVYQNANFETWARPSKMWNELVKWPDGEQRPRFVLESLDQPAEAKDFSSLFGGTTPTPRATGEG